MKSKSLIFSTGLAMFSMFFGSGNLVFPLVVGQMSYGHTFFSSLGILMTGVLVPFLGILGMLLFNGETNQFFSRMGKRATFWFSLFALAIMGPFGVLARCITVAHGAYRLIFPETPLWLFSLVACSLLFLLTIRKNRIVTMLGTILTPLLLLSLVCIAIFGLGSKTPSPVLETGAWESFKTGIFEGYQTMDLLAAFFFSTFVINHLRQKKVSEERSLPIFFKAALIGASILAIIYVVLVLLGSAYSLELGAVPPQEMLGRVAQLSLGSAGAMLVCTAVVLACITTAIVLTSLFADFIRKEVPKEFESFCPALAKRKMSQPVSLLITLTIGFFISNLSFSGIMSFLGPILALIYPALIVMTVFNIAYKLWGWKSIRTPTAVALAIKFFSSI